MNRVSIAHLSIEKAIKFLIQEAGGKIIAKHHLGNRFRELKEHDPDSAEFLGDVFVAARSHYGINHKSEGLKHFRSFETYLDTTGSDDAFNNNNGIRYWELSPTLENALLRKVHLSIHTELLYGLHEILIEPDRPKEIVGARVERAVELAMSLNGGLSYSPETENRKLAKCYFEWLNQFGKRREAIADAVRRCFAFDNAFSAEITRAAYKTLLNAKDPAIRHFASTLDVLPRQSWEATPDIQWLDGKTKQKGKVVTPSGEVLGFIQRGPHGLWYITPIKTGPVGVSAKAETQQDAICYLTQLLTRPARVAVDGKQFTVRVVGEELHLFKAVPVQSSNHEENRDETKLYTASFWDENHGIEKGQEIRIEAQKNASEGLTFSDALSGYVQEAQAHQVSVLGRSFTVVGRA